MLLFLFIIGLILELLAYWRPAKLTVGGAVAAIAAFSGAAVVAASSVFSILLAIISVYRILNLLRIVENRLHKAYLRRIVPLTGRNLLAAQLAVALSWFAWHQATILPLTAVAIVAWLQAVCAAVLLLITLRNLVKSRYFAHQHLADRELPSITVAIPARNETEDLAACLHSLLANDYPKLEILVLDDCSQDKTPEIIRSFAHAGVRFVRGDAPKDSWLAKNQAYEKLAKAANGQFILFCGVDTRFGSRAIRTLVSAAITRRKQMVCVLPKRYGGSWNVSFVQPMRYWWELVLPRRSFNRPPSLSTCWLIEKRALQKAGGLAAVSNSIMPEAYFANKTITTDGYSFLRSNEELDVQTTKKLAEQRATAIRTRYPQLRRRIENVLLLSLLEAVLLIAPFVLAIAGFWFEFGVAHPLAIIASLLLVAIHCLIITVTNPVNWWLSLFNFPLVAMADILLTNSSLYKYEFSEITWKGRNVCLPSMNVTKHLPKF